VGRQQDRRPLLVEFGDEFPEVVAELDVDAGGRLVQDEQVGLGDQGSSEQESAFHPAGEPVEALVALVVDPDAFENLVGSVGGFGVRNAVVARLVFQYFSDREESVDVELLWGEADRVAGLPVVVLDVVAEDARLAAGLADQADQRVDERRLARPLGPSRPKNSPSSTVSDSSCRARRSPYSFTRSTVSMAGGIGTASAPTTVKPFVRGTRRSKTGL